MSRKYGCKYCNYKGYVKYGCGSTSENEEGSVSVSVCSHCKDSQGYYAYVRNKYGTQKDENIINLIEEEPTAKILDFCTFKKNKEGE